MNKNITVKLYRNPLTKGRYRNNPCVCGSGKKMKQCHGSQRVISRSEMIEVSEMVRKIGDNMTDFAIRQAKQDEINNNSED